MRILVNSFVDVKQDIDLKSLGTLEKITVALKNGFINTTFYKNREQRRLDKERDEIVKREENIKTALFSIMHYELSMNSTLKNMGNDECVEVVIRVPREYDSVIKRITQSDDFMVYDIKEVPIDADLLVAYEDLPILLKIRKGGLV